MPFGWLVYLLWFWFTTVKWKPLYSLTYLILYLSYGTWYEPNLIMCNESLYESRSYRSYLLMLTFLSHQLTEVALIKTKRPVLVLLWDTHSQGSVRYVESSIIEGKIKTCTLSWTHPCGLKHEEWYIINIDVTLFFPFFFCRLFTEQAELCKRANSETTIFPVRKTSESLKNCKLH